MSDESCMICKSQLVVGLKPWHKKCNCCGYEKSSLTPKINDIANESSLDETQRKSGLYQLRKNNFESLITILNKFKVSGRLLDIGSAHGWFLESAKSSYEVCGIEPDHQMFELSRSRGFPVLHGYFPEALGINEQFDLIVFNDVFEHIADSKNILKTCHERLNEGGLLIINLPSSTGIIYRISRLICRAGFSQCFDRLWQKDLPSPHLHYFNNENLTRLMEQNYFTLVQSGRLDSISLTGLYHRISYTRDSTPIVSFLLYISIILLSPLFKILPRDIIYVVARAKNHIDV